MKRIAKFLFSRFMVVSLLLAAQFAAFILIPPLLGGKVFAVYNTVCSVLSIVITLLIVNKHDHPSYKVAWLIPVLLMPLVGVTLYFILSGNKLPERRKRKMNRIDAVTRRSLVPVAVDVEEFGDNTDAAVQSNYITAASGCPPCTGTATEYYKIGEEYQAALLSELEKAERYIFLEYFIIADGRMWNDIRRILVAKAAAGVDVRVIYDDFGSIFVLPDNFEADLDKDGVKTRCFQRYIPILNARLNNRDHRKIAVIDGKVAFTGGINIADEYINEKLRFGHWKDCGIKLTGNAAWNMTVLFLSMWDYLGGEPESESYNAYLPEDFGNVTASGVVQPYTDNPLDCELVGENIYLGMANRATKYIYIMTPYLIIDNQMETALCTAAKSGIDVRIITPGVPDKFFVHECTRSFYPELIKSGVKIFEYTPGFVHSKTFVADGQYATVGTVNLDYRSLYLHFECGVWMYNSSAIGDVKNDFLETQTLCHEITEEDCKTGFFRSLLRKVLVVFAPLL